MRVLHLYAGNLYGGIERVLATLARRRALCPSMHAHFALCFEGRLSRELADTSAPLTMLGEARLSRPWTVAAARRRLRDLLDARDDARFDVAIGHSYWSYGIFAPVIRARQIPLVFWAHDIPAGRGWLERWARRVRPDLVLANSRFTASAVPKLFADVPVEVQHNPVEPPMVADRPRVRRETRLALEAHEGACVILIASRLERWKGHALLLQSLARLRDVNEWECWIAGGPQRAAEEAYQSELKDQARSLGIDRRVRFLGQRDDVHALLAAADVLCQPNTGPEPFGVAFVEALAAGVPVVTTNLGAAPEIADDSCGRLVTPDAASVASALRSLIESPDLRRSLGAAGPARARDLSDVERVMNELHGRLENVARASTPGSRT
jgi:glycosyltransferase involved in cell wall biosynthesis